ncbi:MAG: putative lipid II flippase FtsW [Pseudomonadales bacterium]|jgi:cell division protein FtsW|nr:putative lipid II flippase FtsW [Pseudomonadales bacterium]
MNTFAALLPRFYRTQRYYGDPWLVILTALLVGFGLVMMTSASIEIASRSYGDGLYYFKRQLVFLAVGVGVSAFMLSVPMRFWYRGSVAWLALAYALLVLVLVPGIGHEVNGSVRWFSLSAFSFQASEPAKLLIVFFMAWFLSRHRVLVRHSIKGLLIPLILLGFPVSLLLLEPDFGAVVVLGIAVFGMLFLAGVRLYLFLGMAGLAVGGAWLLVVSSEYRMQRLMTFLQALKDPFSDDVVFGSGYQLAQALIAFGRGEWFGVGLGNSIQKMYFLPEAHTDFVLAIIAEELGVVSVLLLLVLFFAFVLRAMLIARRNEKSGRLFAAYLGYGIAFLFMGQVLINVAVNTGLLPTKGLTLPFLSYGGSSLLMCLVMTALLLRIDIEHHELQHESQQPRLNARPNPLPSVMPEPSEPPRPLYQPSYQMAPAPRPVYQVAQKTVFAPHSGGRAS